MMYQAYQNHMDLMEPWRSGAAQALKYLNLVPQGVSDKLFGRLAAALELISRTSLTYTRPAYGIDKVLVGNQELAVTEQVVFATPFGSLLHFNKENSPEQPRMLLVAPMSGHFATLLRGTVKTLLQDHDVYITDWHNPRDIPLGAGKFGLDEYTDHLIAFLDQIGPRSHMVAICQPSVSALAAAGPPERTPANRTASAARRINRTTTPLRLMAAWTLLITSPPAGPGESWTAMFVHRMSSRPRQGDLVQVPNVGRGMSEATPTASSGSR